MNFWGIYYTFKLNLCLVSLILSYCLRCVGGCMKMNHRLGKSVFIAYICIEFIFHSKEGNRKTQAKKLCVFCFFSVSHSASSYIFLKFLSLCESFPCKWYAVRRK